MDDTPITADELRAALASDRRERPETRDPAVAAANGRRVLHDLIDRRLLGQAAQLHGIRVSDAEIQRSVEALRLDYPGTAFDELLEEEGLSLEVLKARNAGQLLIEKLFLEEVFARVAITDAEVDEWLEANPGALDRPAQVRALQLVVKTEEEARSLHTQLRKGADFQELAREHSLSPDAKMGGDLGWFAKGEMPPPFDEVCFALAPGRISDVVGSSFGFHLFKVLEKRPARSPEIAELRAEAEARLRAEKESMAQERYLEQLRAAAAIHIDEEALMRLSGGEASR